MKKWGFLDQNKSELSFFSKKTKKIALILTYDRHSRGKVVNWANFFMFFGR